MVEQQREVMEFDVLIVGAGPSGLAAACKLMLLAEQNQTPLSVAILEKGSEIGAHILSGAIIDPKALDELFPNWKAEGAPLTTQVTEDQFHLLNNQTRSTEIPHALLPTSIKNRGNYIASLGLVCRWLGEKAEALGVEIFTGFTGKEVLYHADGSVKGILTGDLGVDKSQKPKDNYLPGIELHAKQTLFCEGARGSLGKQLKQKLNLEQHKDAQHYALGFKEIWQIPEHLHQPGLVIHGTGWPIHQSSAGFYLYHADNQQVLLGLIVDLNYSNPHLSPFEEFQKLKHHPLVAKYLDGGTRISYGARAIAKGGLNSLCDMGFAGGLILGCNAGTLNGAKIKGTHTAMKSGILAAQAIFPNLDKDAYHKVIPEQFDKLFKESWLYEELYSSRNFIPAMHNLGFWGGSIFNFVDQNWLRGKSPLTLTSTEADHSQLASVSQAKPIEYSRPDGKLSFDKMASVYLSNIYHDEDQPSHIKLGDQTIPIEVNLPRWNEPAVRFCPAGVFELSHTQSESELIINTANCLHCKTCDIKDPSQNITWTVPEGGSGPNYSNM